MLKKWNQKINVHLKIKARGEIIKYHKIKDEKQQNKRNSKYINIEY